MSCSNNMKQLGLALQNFHNSNNRFPGSGQLDVAGTSSSGSTHTVGGWSFLVMVLPYIEFGSIYSTLQIRGGDPTNPSSIFGHRHPLLQRRRQRGHGNLDPLLLLPQQSKQQVPRR